MTRADCGDGFFARWLSAQHGSSRKLLESPSSGSRYAAGCSLIFWKCLKPSCLRRLKGRAEQEGRSDDTEETIRARLQTYEQGNRVLCVRFYDQRGLLVPVDGAGGDADSVFTACLAALQPV